MKASAGVHDCKRILVDDRPVHLSLLLRTIGETQEPMAHLSRRHLSRELFDRHLSGTSAPRTIAYIRKQNPVNILRKIYRHSSSDARASFQALTPAAIESFAVSKHPSVNSPPRTLGSLRTDLQNTLKRCFYFSQFWKCGP